MKSVTALEAKNRFGEVLEAAQRQPVCITRNGRPSVVMISAESYARRQRMARDRLRQAMERAGEHAAAQGMNEDLLDQLLEYESLTAGHKRQCLDCCADLSQWNFLTVIGCRTGSRHRRTVVGRDLR